MEYIKNELEEMLANNVIDERYVGEVATIVDDINELNAMLKSFNEFNAVIAESAGLAENVSDKPKFDLLESFLSRFLLATLVLLSLLFYCFYL